MALEGLKLGHYQLFRLIGSGGMGEVYLAEDARLSRHVAIKVIRAEVSSYPDTIANREAARLFQREAKAIAMMDHPHILPLFDYGEELVNGAQFIYLVMPFRQEGSLANWLYQRNDANLLSVGDVEHFIDQAADALLYAHNLQIIHQDVKPSNFLIRNNAGRLDRPDLLLTDFGVAKLSSATSSISHSVRGTPTYMAPEQWSGNAVPATDQYALAVMAYELLAGRPPFQGSPMQMMYLHTQQLPPSPSTLNPQIPADMDSVLLCALAKQPADRFASINAFSTAFSQALQDIDSPTIINTLHQPTSQPASHPVNQLASQPVNQDVRVTLAIGELEALQGTQRRLSLPDGRQVVVSIPPNAYDGQIIRLDSLGRLVSSAGSTGAFALILNIKHATEAFASSNPGNIDLTVPASHPSLLTLTAQIPSHVQEQPPVQQPGSPRRSYKRRIVLLLVLIIFLLAGASGFLLYTNVKNQQTFNAAATGTTGSLNNQATAQANTATAQANANATAQANANATAQANATATAISTSNTPDPYPPYYGAVGLNDPLRDNTQGNAWQTYQDSLSACEFTGGSYHAVETKNTYFANCFSDPYFSNFVLQVQMQIIQGDCGGIMFRADPTHTLFYYFRVCQDGSYALYRYVDNKNTDALSLTSNSSPYINTGVSSSNTIAVVANGSVIDLYANSHFIAAASDGAYTDGHIGLVAQSEGNVTDVAYSNMLVWVG